MRASTIHSRADPSPTKLIKQRTVVDNKLQILAQNLDPEQEPATTSFRKTFIHATAELYRLAALLYLQRVCPLSTDERTREIYLDQAFHTLEVLDVATCPWPLFIFACESQSDDQRIQILRTVDRMDQARGLGNIFTLRSIIEGFWTQCDLRADSSSASQIKWWEMVNCDTAMPWFI